MKVLICLFFLLPVTFIYGQKQTISARHAKNYMGKTVTVFDTIHEARLDNVSKDEMNVLFTGSDYDHRTFALVFPQSILKRFSYNPNYKMVNHRFYATGKIVNYKGKPAMFIKNESQIKIPE
ncbi:MAG: hypothetical protein M3R72_04555 [Bacteroidota bacterium]|nr:hypothetical protein [Bacteroidota bacterium]